MLAVMESGEAVGARVLERKPPVRLVNLLDFGAISDGECGLVSVTVYCSLPLFDALVVALGESTFVRITKSVTHL